MSQHQSAPIYNDAKAFIGSHLAQNLPRPWVVCNGCFDLIHQGHLFLLEKASVHGNSLIVALNSDASVAMQNKKGSRPFLSQTQRAALLAGLIWIDAVVLFTSISPKSLIEIIKPEVLVKGDDWSQEKVAGASLLQSWGGKLVRISRIEDLSTTKMAHSIASKCGPLDDVDQ